MDYEKIDSTDMAEMALSQAIDDHIDNSQEAIDRISELEGLIKTWDTKDVRILKSWIAEIRILLQKNFQVHIDNFMNLKKIPTMKVPEQVRQFYRIIAVDQQGNALYGPEMDKIAPLTKIIAHYKAKVQGKKKA